MAPQHDTNRSSRGLSVLNGEHFVFERFEQSATRKNAFWTERKTYPYVSKADEARIRHILGVTFNGTHKKVQGQWGSGGRKELCKVKFVVSAQL